MAAPAWITEFHAFSTFFVADGVAWIAAEQSRVSKRKLTLDYYDKRLCIYAAMWDLIEASLRPNSDLKESKDKAYKEKAEAQFLLKPKAVRYLDELVAKAVMHENLIARSGINRSELAASYTGHG